MKRFFALAALVLGLAACQTEPEGLDVNVGGEVDTTITVAISDSETRANSALGAFDNVVASDEYTIRYILQVYYKGEPSKERLVKYSDETYTTFDVRLVPGRHYNFVVWADVVKEADKTDLHYNTTNLHNITLKQTWVAMDETRDAFTGFFDTEKEDSDKPYNGKMSINIQLTRPFAKLRVITTDMVELGNLGIAPYKGTVTYTTKHRESFNACNGNYGEQTKEAVTLTYNIASYEDNDTQSKVVFTDYFFANDDVVKFTMDIMEADGSSIKFNNFSTDIPVKRNYLTTIKGDILTDGNNIKVDVNDEFTEIEWPNENETTEQLAYAAMFGGEVTLTENVELTQPLEIVEGANVVINLEGKTLTGAIELAEGAELTVNNGVIKNTDRTVSGITSNGDLTLNNVTIESARHGVRVESGNVVINGGVYKVVPISNSTLHALNVGDDGTTANVVIKGGTFIGPKGTMADSGSAVNVRNGSSVVIEGGNFSGGKSKTLSGVNITVKGGTFDQNPSSFLAAGYKAVQSGDKYMVVKEDVGGVATDNATLDTAIKNAQDGDTIALNAGEYVIPDSAVGKTITFVGTGAPEDTLITAQNDGAAEGNCDYSLRGSKATFENVTITTTGTYFPGYAGCQGTYKNCIINGVFTLYDSSSFEDCTFNISGDLYNVWTWGAAEATFTNCTFNCDGKAMLLYGQANTKLTMNNCVFNDNGDDTVTGKAAIEIGNDYNKSYELTVNNATVNGFAINPNGFVTGTTLWANKNSMPADKLKVTVDGKNAYNYVAAANDTQSFTDAIDNGATEVALSNGNYTMPEPDLRGKTLTISGTKDVVIDATAVDARDQFVTGATMVFDGVTINFGNANYMGFANTASLKYKNCHINGLQFLFGENVEFENCTFNSNGAEHSVWTYGAKNVSFTKCDFTYGDRCVNCYSDNDVVGGKQTVNFTECTFATENTASEGAVEINSCFFSVGIEVNLNGCTAPAHGQMAYVSPWDSTNGAKTTINIK